MPNGDTSVLVLIRVLLDIGGGERKLVVPVHKLPAPGEALNLPGNGTCVVRDVSAVPADQREAAIVDAVVAAKLIRHGVL